jgi:tetratricopeptide (TPR) repeat protein
VLSLLGAPAKVDEPDSGPLLRAAFEQMVSSLCQDRVHCLAWDDAQAIDRESLDTILKVMRHPGGLAVTVMLALRGEPPELLGSGRPIHAVELGELSEGETARFVEAQLGARAVPAELLRHVRAVAGGHPLFLDELLRELTDAGSVRVLSGKVVALPEAETPAPRKLSALIAARVARLPDDERRVLQAVAILGIPAFTHVLASVLSETLPSLDRYLASLGAKSLVRRTGPTKVHFASPLYREIVLEGMVPAERQRLHARVAETYQQATVTPAEGDAAERVAQHLLEAGQRTAAVDVYWQSAERKLGRGQLEPAVRAMVRALATADLAERPVDQLAAWVATLAATVSQTRSAPGLRDPAWAAARQIEARGTARQRAKAYIDLSLALGSVNLFDEAYQALERAELASADDVELQRAGLGADISIAARQGLFLRAVAAADRLAQLGPIEHVPTMLAIAHARGAIGQSEVAHKLLDRVDAISEPADAAEAVMRQKTRCLIYFDSRDFEAAAREARQLARLARTAGLRYDAAAALHNLGDALDRMGDHARSYAAFMESLDITRLIDHERLTALNRMHLCLLDGLRNVAGAEDRLKGLIRFADARGYLWDVLEGSFLVARLALHRGALDEARRCLEEVVALAEQQGHELIAVDGRALLASL